jgi:hypothetical protein
MLGVHSIHPLSQKLQFGVGKMLVVFFYLGLPR